MLVIFDFGVVLVVVVVVVGLCVLLILGVSSVVMVFSVVGDMVVEGFEFVGFLLMKVVECCMVL